MVIKMKNVSIKDIAKLSGVSVATVSRVINNNGRFSEETKQKVLAVIEETGYQMNFSAKSLRMNKSFSIGVLVPDISNYFFSDVVQKIEEQLFELGYSTIICNTGRSSEKENAYLKMLQSKLVDGLIVISGADEFDSNTDNIPYICIDREPKEKERTIFISSNHYQGAFEATEALLHSNSKEPAIAMYDRASSSSKERFEGFRDALKKNNYLYQEKKNLFLIETDNKNIERSLKTFLSHAGSTDGFFAVNDTIAMELLFNLPKLNKKVPKDVKVIGFDNTPQAIYSTPSLSSVEQDTAKIAKLAVENLIGLMTASRITTNKSILVPTHLVERESSKE